MLWTIRTADRSPKRNYLGATVRGLLEAGVDPRDLHLFPTAPDIRWMDRELVDLPPIHLHVPDARVSPNANGIRQVEALDWSDDDWLAMLEDDLVMAPRPRLIAWLVNNTTAAIHVYRWFALPGTPLLKVGPDAALAPLKEMRGSQAVVLRALDAWAFHDWATAHPRDWRPKGAPFQDRPDRGFDKLLGYWALQQWPDQPNGLVSVPMLVNHVGRESLLHSHGLRNDALAVVR
jgi:hypothetical protein